MSPSPSARSRADPGSVKRSVRPARRTRPSTLAGPGNGGGGELRGPNGRPFVEIIQACHRDGCDLVVKAAKGTAARVASPREHRAPSGRKCPVPVWLVGEKRSRPRVASWHCSPAIPSDERHALDRRVLGVACSFASRGAELMSVPRGTHPGRTCCADGAGGEASRIRRRRTEAGRGRAGARPRALRELDQPRPGPSRPGRALRRACGARRRAGRPGGSRDHAPRARLPRS